MSKEIKSTADGKIVIRQWPKTPVFYPMAFCALLCGFVSTYYEQNKTAELPKTPAPVPAVEKLPAPAAPNVPSYLPGSAPANPAPSPVPEAAPAPAATPPQVNPMAASSPNPGGTDETPADLVNTAMAMLFLFVFAFSIFVVCIDFGFQWSLLGFACVLLTMMGLYMAERLGKIDLPTPAWLLAHFHLYASPLFYYSIFVIWAILMVISWVIARLHYVRIEASEIVAIGGVLENQRRVSTMRMTWTKSVTDVFEYWLPFVRSGTLIFKFPNDEPIVLENVLNINKVMRRLDQSNLSGARGTGD